MKSIAIGTAVLLSGGLLWLGQSQHLHGGSTGGSGGMGDARAGGVGAGMVALEGGSHGLSCHNAAALAGLTPVTAALAGLSPEDVERCLDAVLECEALNELSGALQDLDDAHGRLRTLDRRVMGGDADQDAAAQRAAVLAEIAGLESAIAAGRAGIFATIAGELTQGQAELLERVRANARWRVPDHYRVLAASESEWRVIERAFRRHEAAIAQEESLDQHSAGVLEAVESHAEVIAAALRLAAMEELEAAFTSLE